MNHKQKQEEIFEDIEDKKLGIKQNMDDYIQLGALQSDLKSCKQKAKAHKKEVEKGCFKFVKKSEDFFYRCGDCGNLYCKDCQEVLNKYEEMGI